MDEAKTLVGVVGVGYLGKFHAEKYAASDRARLVGVVDVDEARAREVIASCSVEFNASALWLRPGSTTRSRAISSRQVSMCW